MELCVSSVARYKRKGMKETRKKHLVELLHDHGLSISYDRVLEVSAQLGDAAVGKYRAEGVVCPNILRNLSFR